MTPVWPIRGGRGVKLTGYLDSPHMLSQYLLIYSEAIKATIKKIKAKTQNQLFYDPSLTHKGGRGVKLTGYLHSPHMLSQYLLIYSEAIKATIKEIKAKTQNRLFYDPSLTHKGQSGGKTDRLFRLSIYAFPIPLDTFWSYKSNNKGEKRQKLKISYFMTPVWPIRGAVG